MATDLETMKTEILAYLGEVRLPVFYGYPGFSDPAEQIFWDTEHQADFRKFLQVAQSAGAKLIIFHHRAFSLDQIDEALDHLEDSDLTREEKRNFESRLRELQPYEGFTCSLELSFVLDGRTYVYERNTEWYRNLQDVLSEIEAVTGEDVDDSDEGIGGYFSNN